MFGWLHCADGPDGWKSEMCRFSSLFVSKDCKGIPFLDSWLGGFSLINEIEVTVVARSKSR